MDLKRFNHVSKKKHIENREMTSGFTRHGTMNQNLTQLFPPSFQRFRTYLENSTRQPLLNCILPLSSTHGIRNAIVRSGSVIATNARL